MTRQWDSPTDWFESAALSRGTIYAFIRNYISEDEIEEYFWREMNDTGYFEDGLVDCPACDGNDDDCDICCGIGHVTEEEHDAYHNPTEAKNEAQDSTSPAA